MSPYEVVEIVTIDAPASAVWSAVSDPCEYGRWSPEATGAMRNSGTGAWAVGDRFTGLNRARLSWRTQCRVVVAQSERRFAFDVNVGPFPIARWAFELEALPDGCTRVTQRWTDRRDGVLGVLAKPAGLPVGRGYDAATRNRQTMRATLDALKADLESN
ncbi:MAG: SRPBCC family protein [Actinobacteria bacterium]|nr:SRPBCC family protein [Actinomycetota bacterium]